MFVRPFRVADEVRAFDNRHKKPNERTRAFEARAVSSKNEGKSTRRYHPPCAAPVLAGGVGGRAPNPPLSRRLDISPVG